MEADRLDAWQCELCNDAIISTINGTNNFRDNTMYINNNLVEKLDRLKWETDNNINRLENELNKNNINAVEAITTLEDTIRHIEQETKNMKKEINEKLNWQAICLYLTWAMLIVLGFMICFKSFDISVEVNNPIQNQEVILKHE